MPQKYDIFISYRRKDAGDKAEHLKDLLEPKYKQRISFDRENITGIFNTALIERIDQVKDFVLVLGKNSFVYTDTSEFDAERVAFYNHLTSCNPKEFAEEIQRLGPNAPLDYVRVEIGRALKRGNNLHLIPVVPERTTDFNFSNLDLPDDIAGIKHYEAVFYSDNPDALFKDVVPKLEKQLQSKPDKPIRKILGIVGGVLFLLVLLMGIHLGITYHADKEAYAACRTYADYYAYHQEAHTFYTQACQQAIQRFEELENGGMTAINNTSGEAEKEMIEVRWSEDISLSQLHTLIGVIDSMMYVPRGTFTMGTDTPLDDEGPAHAVTLTRNFYLSKYELTRDVWFSVMLDSVVNDASARLPMTGISWDECQEFLRILNELTGLDFTLPSEAQWEYAAKGAGVHKALAGDGKLNNLAWHRGNAMHRLHTTAECLAPNALEIYNMLGNVSEWCSDYAYADYSREPQVDPIGATESKKHIVRGGSYLSESEEVTTTYRDAADSHTQSDAIGMRLLLTATD